MILQHKNNTIKIKGGVLDLEKKCVMGILNLTPDSFYDGGRLSNMPSILTKVEQMLNDGAAIIDVGGYSSRPKAIEISIEEELNRVIPVIKEIKRIFPEAILSVDTFRASVAEKAIGEGADMINDIGAGVIDPALPHLISKSNIPYIIMHMQGIPDNMQENPSYQNVVKDVLQFFSNRINYLHQIGIKDIIIDPGFGFGKRQNHNYELLNKLSLFEPFNHPIMVGLSRKSMIYNVLQTQPDNALNGTTALNTLAILNGASILRVHDVKEAVEAIKLVDLYLNPNKQ